MIDDFASLALEHLRALRGEQERIESGLREIGARLTSLETSTAADRRDSTHDYTEIVRQQSKQFDQVKAPIDRIWRRLEIAARTIAEWAK
jgi:hypothetical protein